MTKVAPLVIPIPICPIFPEPTVVIVPSFTTSAPFSANIPIFLLRPLNSILPVGPLYILEPFPVAYIPILSGVVTLISPWFSILPIPLVTFLPEPAGLSSLYPAAIPIPYFLSSGFVCKSDLETFIVP